MLLSEDIVYFNQYMGTIENSPYSSDEESEEEFEESLESEKVIPIYPKSTQRPYTVEWQSDLEYPYTHHSENELQLLDRSICKGDVILYKNQLATVVQVDCFYDLFSHLLWTDIDHFEDYILKNVAGSLLRRDHEYLMDEPVFYDRCMGIIQDSEMNCMVLVRHDNEHCYVSLSVEDCFPLEKSLNLHFTTTLPSHNSRVQVKLKHGYQQDIVPGTFLDIKSLKALIEPNTELQYFNHQLAPVKKPHWISDIVLEDRAMVIALLPTQIQVEWQINQSADSDFPDDVISTNDTHLQSFVPISKRHLYPCGSLVKKDNDFYQILNIRSFLTLQTQDNQIISKIPSIQVEPTLFLNDEDFMPGDFVSLNLKIGLILSSDPLNRTASVRFFEDQYLNNEIIEIPFYQLRSINKFNLTSACLADQDHFYGEINSINLDNGKIELIFFDNSTKFVTMDDILALEDDENSWETTSQTTIDTSGSGSSASSSEVSEVPDVTTHHFLENKAPKNLLKRVKHELKLLKDCSSTIVIKNDLDRLDLWRAMIIGPVGTPFEDGSFFFDIALPSLYPLEPPSVAFKSLIQKQINPNLFVNGSICISLLEKTDKQDCEHWTKDSSLLQLVLSIQSLILTAKPFGNEPMHSKLNKNEYIRSQDLYQERAIIGSLESVAVLLKSPIEEFKQDINDFYYLNGGLQRLINRTDAIIKQTKARGTIQVLESLQQDFKQLLQSINE